MSTPVPFQLNVPDTDLADLRARLARTRWPDEPGPADAAPWQTGTDRTWLQRLCTHWAGAFDWRAQEARLNAWPQYKVALHGIDLHFLHAPGRGPKPMPLLLSHGWPGSVFEFLRILPMLTDPAAHGGSADDAFTVVAPSLPGYGLSFAPGQKRMGVPAIAGCFADLMTQVLGYPRFGAQGGDWGSSISSRLGLMHADQLIGVHLNLLMLPREPNPFPNPNDEERAYLAQLANWVQEESGYNILQATRPQTLAYALTDSPAGLAAWIGEKFRQWSDCGGNPDAVFSADELLANISLYWFTGAIGSSFWPYYARLHEGWPLPVGAKVTVPMGYAQLDRKSTRLNSSHT